MSFDFGLGSDFAANGDDSTGYGLSYVYRAAKWAELYAGAKLYSLDRDNLDVDDVTVLAVGTRLKF